jgi:hypothetical protein
MLPSRVSRARRARTKEGSQVVRAKRPALYSTKRRSSSSVSACPEKSSAKSWGEEAGEEEGLWRKRRARGEDLEEEAGEILGQEGLVPPRQRVDVLLRALLDGGEVDLEGVDVEHGRDRAARCRVALARLEQHVAVCHQCLQRGRQ